MFNQKIITNDNFNYDPNFRGRFIMFCRVNWIDVNYYSFQTNHLKLHSFKSLGIWASLDRSENSIGVKKSNSPPIPIWTPKSAPPSPTAERKFRPVPFESPTLERKKLPSQDTATPPWQQANYSDKPYQPSVIRSSSCNTVTSTPKIQTTHQIIYRKARGKLSEILSFFSSIKIHLN